MHDRSDDDEAEELKNLLDAMFRDIDKDELRAEVEWQQRLQRHGIDEHESQELSEQEH